MSGREWRETSLPSADREAEAGHRQAAHDKVNKQAGGGRPQRPPHAPPPLGLSGFPGPSPTPATGGVPAAAPPCRSAWLFATCLLVSP